MPNSLFSKFNDFEYVHGVHIDRDNHIYFKDKHHRFRRYYMNKRAEMGKKYPKRKDRVYIVDRSLLAKVVDDIFAEVRDGIINHKSGVHLKGLGYFFVFNGVYNRKLKFDKRNESTKSVYFKRYYPMFIPTNSKFFGWSMDYQFLKDIYNSIYDKVKEGNSYINMFKSVAKNKDGFRLGWTHSKRNRVVEYWSKYRNYIRYIRRKYCEVRYYLRKGYDPNSWVFKNL